ncbi:N-acetylglucosamine kinase [Cryptosporangium phraense]|uniref:N-acetylglucosamine kinase n=1 Tax=Cryptosporangium phraense TaxID=2593070 RepID=UPI001F0D8E35|nr:BadF/BadG/BcrA/BcrD ATPase family protein [Cryptosporangium phraense]
MTVVVALDAGNSKTDAIALRADGSVLATARGGGFRPVQDGVEVAMAALVDVIRRVLEAAGPGAGVAGAGVGVAGPGAGVAGPVAGGEGPAVALVAAYLANADFPVEVERYRGWLERLALGRRTVVGNDTVALLRSGTAGRSGVAVICGAGINCLGVGTDGTVFRFPALGKLSGDWGGGAGLAQEAMFVAARAEDGRGPATALAPAIAAHFGVGSAAAVAEELHFERIEPSRLHELAPLLFEAATAGDEVARTIVARQAEEIALMAGVALRRLNLTDQPVEVVLGGGVLAAGHEVLLDDVRARILAVAPRATLRIPAVSPLVGAALLALEELGAPPAAGERVRATYAQWSSPLVRT